MTCLPIFLLGLALGYALRVAGRSPRLTELCKTMIKQGKLVQVWPPLDDGEDEIGGGE